MLSNLNSMQSTIQDLKEIVSKTQESNTETIVLVRQMEQILADIEKKTVTGKQPSDLDLPIPHPAP